MSPDIRRVLLALFAAGALNAPALAQDAPVDDGTEVEAVVVQARRIGVPVWRVGDNLILVGHITAVPKETKWRPGELGRAVGQADFVIFPHAETATPADLVRVVLRSRSLVLLPKGETLSNHVDPQTIARLKTFQAKGVFKPSFMRLQPWALSDNLLDSAGVQTRGVDLARLVRQEAREQRKPHQVVGQLTAESKLDRLLKDGTAPQRPCLEAALDAAEAAPGVAARRIEDYTHYRVAAVAASPAERALNACWLTGADPATTARLRQDWRTRLEARTSGPGVTLAVVPLRFLAEDGGVLDTFTKQGLRVDGPRWRAAQP